MELQYQCNSADYAEAMITRGPRPLGRKVLGAVLWCVLITLGTFVMVSLGLRQGVATLVMIAGLLTWTLWNSLGSLPRTSTVQGSDQWHIVRQQYCKARVFYLCKRKLSPTTTSSIIAVELVSPLYHPGVSLGELRPSSSNWLQDACGCPNHAVAPQKQ